MFLQFTHTGENLYKCAFFVPAQDLQFCALVTHSLFSLGSLGKALILWRTNLTMLITLASCSGSTNGSGSTNASDVAVRSQSALQW